MERLKASIFFSFRAKVILPVVVVMIVLMGVSMWMVNRRVTRQLQDDAARMLRKDEAVLRNSREIRANDLLLRYRNMVIEPRFKAVSGLSDAKTFRYLLNELIEEGAADVIVLASDSGRKLSTVSHVPWIDPQSFEQSCAVFLQYAMQGTPVVEVLQNNNRLFDVVVLPILVGDEVNGAVAFAVENTMAHDFHTLMQSDLILASGGIVLASTLFRPEVEEELLAALEKEAAESSGQNRLVPVLVDDEHMLIRSGTLDSPGHTPEVNYLIVSSYEKPLQVLRATQQMILLVCAIAILAGAAIIWWIVRHVTQPLRELCNSAEAIGQGDFSNRVHVRSQDECGELALAFNRMTEKLKTSRDQLESTVERLKSTRAQLVQSEKLSGIGEFVAGVAHELNNPLTSVMGFSDLLKHGEIAPRHRKFVDMIHSSAQRCQKIVQSLLGFARRHQPERKPVCVNQVVEAALDILRYQLRTNNIEAVLQLAHGVPEAMIDPHQIQQVLVNLINNARQAIEAYQPSGTIWITTEAVGTNVVITIKDSGPGIPESSRSKIFDPFFTTKPVGTGTGLGLSLCYGIIQEHGGNISVHSKAGEGASFVIQLPITKGQQIESKAPHETIAQPISDQEGRGKRVLVIDDEESIAQMIQEVLNQHGYEVDVALNGEAGLKHLRNRDYDATLCDWKMPGLSGRQVYERLRVTQPEQANRVVFITGDLVNEETRRFIELQQRTCIAKPFDLTEFRVAISRAMAN